MSVKAAMAESSHTKWRVPSSDTRNNLLSGPNLAAQFGMNWWWKLIRPRNSRSFLIDVG